MCDRPLVLAFPITCSCAGGREWKSRRLPEWGCYENIPVTFSLFPGNMLRPPRGSLINGSGHFRHNRAVRCLAATSSRGSGFLRPGLSHGFGDCGSGGVEERRRVSLSRFAIGGILFQGGGRRTGNRFSANHLPGVKDRILLSHRPSGRKYGLLFMNPVFHAFSGTIFQFAAEPFSEDSQECPARCLSTLP